MNLGNVLVSKGAATGQRALVSEGISYLEEALRIKPDFERARNNLDRAKEFLSTL
jgi:hypothetical protein